MHLLIYTWLRAKHHNTQKILLPYRFCGDSHHAFAFPFVLIFLPLRLSCKESSTSNQAFSIVFTTPSVPLVGDRNLRRKDITALLGARNRYALRLADHQRSSPYCAGWDRLAVMGISLQLYCWKWVHGGGLQIETTIFVPHCSIALRLSSLEWGIFRMWQQ